MKKLVYFVSEDWYFCSHRLEVAKCALHKGYDVYLVCNVDKHQKQIEDAGIKVIPINIDRSSVGLLANLKLMHNVWKIFRSIQPDVVHNVAQKPVLLGTIAARLCGVPRIVNALGGLGFVFISQHAKARILKRILSSLYRLLFNLSGVTLILQNRDDYQFFTDTLNIRESHISLIRGAGINIDDFSFQVLPDSDITKVTLVARMLKDKGVGEFLAAAKLLNDKQLNVEFELVGDIDPKNPNSYAQDELVQIAKESGVSWHGSRSDIFNVWKSSHISVLPSYREGLPKSLLESASVGRAIITTDVPGCREVVKDGYNGFLVPLYSIQELADRMERLINDRQLCQQMGENGRKMVEEHFSSYKVNEKTLALYQVE
ncbi:glycosyltransferase family 4 protein [Paraneptunicella aestuarii]|uniref:glycosyltransferase family 4 protein n=1 Tax=Paraneptunicella aestuarii TaxID=2831148 RepID=UPI001E32DD2E|nr:glycosyltransferase family 4 protein [Paraneptunicella aestuarii]UAA39685.1 glycosyltransferase family 4 protein [Paraneptunicella aestuarii]